MLRTCARFVICIGLCSQISSARAEIILFDFDGGPYRSPTPFDQTYGGVTAQFNSSGDAYSTQPVNTMGFTPVGFAGYCLYPGSVYQSDLLIAFSQSLTDISLMYAPQELATDSSCTMRITAYQGTSYITTNTNCIKQPGTWPTGTLSLTSTLPFDHVVVHYDKPPVTGGDYGPIFMVDNMLITPVPEPDSGCLVAIALGFGSLTAKLRRRMNRIP